MFLFDLIGWFQPKSDLIKYQNTQYKQEYAINKKDIRYVFFSDDAI